MILIDLEEGVMLGSGSFNIFKELLENHFLPTSKTVKKKKKDNVPKSITLMLPDLGNYSISFLHPTLVPRQTLKCNR